MSRSKLLHQYDQLSTAEKIILLQDLWDEIAEQQPDLEIPEEHKRELERRIAAYGADKDRGKPWKDVLGELRSKDGQ